MIIKGIKKALKIISWLMILGAGFLMFGFWLTTMNEWLGFLGTILALILSPGIVIFPIVFWAIEGVFPFFYFIIWGVGFLGIILCGLLSKND